MKHYVLFIAMIGLLNGCVPVSRNVSWQTEHHTVTFEEGREVIGLQESKKKSPEEPGLTYDDLLYDSEDWDNKEPYPMALPLLPWKNTILDFTQK